MLKMIPNQMEFWSDQISITEGEGEKSAIKIKRKKVYWWLKLFHSSIRGHQSYWSVTGSHERKLHLIVGRVNYQTKGLYFSAWVWHFHAMGIHSHAWGLHSHEGGLHSCARELNSRTGGLHSHARGIHSHAWGLHSRAGRLNSCSTGLHSPAGDLQSCAGNYIQIQEGYIPVRCSFLFQECLFLQTKDLQYF